MTLQDYFERVQRLVHDKSLEFERGFEMLELKDSAGKRGRLRGRLGFSPRTFMQVSELIEIRNGKPVVLSYAYYLILDGEQVWAHEDDPTHDPAVHRHDRDHQRFPDEKRTLREMITKAWEVASDEDFWATATVEGGQE